jgi:putative colanic acid biosynthesis UDP-glucose lipid carrier transferase
MSLVGPRPHAVAHNERYMALIDNYLGRHRVKPGITGLAQVNGCRGITDTIDKMERRVAYDLQYIDTWSIILDLKVMIRTVFVGFINNNAF